MRSGLFLTTLIGLAGASHISSAADATWIAVATLENPACDTSFGGPPGPTDWQVDMKGNTLTFMRQTTTKSSFTVDLTALQPDGSGSVVGKDDKNRAFYVTFDPGSGARAFYVTSFESPCRADFTPQR
jgi:hypothetical protein